MKELCVKAIKNEYIRAGIWGCSYIIFFYVIGRFPKETITGSILYVITAYFSGLLAIRLTGWSYKWTKAFNNKTNS